MVFVELSLDALPGVADVAHADLELVLGPVGVAEKVEEPVLLGVEVGELAA